MDIHLTNSYKTVWVDGLYQIDKAYFKICKI